MNFVLLIFILVLLSPLLLFPLYGGWEGLIMLLVTALTMVVLRYADYWMESAAFKKELRRRVKERYADTPWRQRPLLLEALLYETWNMNNQIQQARINQSKQADMNLWFRDNIDRLILAAQEVVQNEPRNYKVLMRVQREAQAGNTDNVVKFLRVIASNFRDEPRLSRAATKILKSAGEQA